MDIETIAAGAIKSDRLGHVKGYLVRFGTPEAADLEGEYFTKATDFGFPAKPGVKVPLNVYYHHGMDPKIGRKSIGTGYVKMDDTGLWYEAQLDMADEYAAMVAKLCKEGKMGYSSGAAGHLVERKSIGSASEITRWPIAEASITPTPAEWRNTVKSIMDMMPMDGEMPEMGEGEMEMPEPPSEGMDPATYADETFADLRMEILHEALEALYEALCHGMAGLAEVDPAMRAEFAGALIDGFASRANEMIAGIDLSAKTLKACSPESLRGVERRLRDAVGLSRSDAKRLAPEIWNTLRDAGQGEGTDYTPAVEATTSTSGREDLLARINYLLEIV